MSLRSKSPENISAQAAAKTQSNQTDQLEPSNQKFLASRKQITKVLQQLVNICLLRRIFKQQPKSTQESYPVLLTKLSSHIIKHLCLRWYISKRDNLGKSHIYA